MLDNTLVLEPTWPTKTLEKPTDLGYDVDMKTAGAMVPSSTAELANAFTLNAFPHTLIAGPVWTSFEQFRKAGASVLEAIPEHGVATLRTKAGTFKVLREPDFQRLLGLASEICRLQQGVKVVVQAAKVFVKNPDQAHCELLVRSASMIAESPELPQRTGHEATFNMTSEEISEEASDNFDLSTAEIPRPKW